MIKSLSEDMLLKIVNEAYPDNKIKEAAETGSANIGNTLAVFLYRELVEDSAGSGTAVSQLTELIGRCDMAIKEIEDVKLALHMTLNEVTYAKNKK